MSGRQYIAYGIIITVVGGLILLILVAVFNTVTEWTIPWEVWVFVPLFGLVFGLIALSLVRDWQRQAMLDGIAARAEALTVIVQNMRKDIDRVDNEHLELIDSVPERLSRLDERVQGLQAKLWTVRESAHRTAVVEVVDRIAAERGWSRRHDLETRAAESGRAQPERALDTPAGLVLVDEWSPNAGTGTSLALQQMSLASTCQFSSAVAAFLVFHAESDVASGAWVDDDKVKRVKLDELEPALRALA